MIRWGESEGRVALRTEDGAKTHELVCQLALGTRSAKKTFLVDKTKRKAADLAALFPAALFSGDDVRLIDGSPGRRRRALDLVLGQSSGTYLEALRRYTRVLASRNRLLEQISTGEAGSDELDFWDAQLIESGTVLLEERQRFVAFANDRLPDLYAGIAKTAARRLSVAYEPLSADLAQDIPERRRQDIAIGTTTAGPHRDDWRVILDNRPLVSFGSGGEFRSAMLAFRMAEAAWLEQELSSVPVLLLDDVFSELDEVRQETLLANLPKGQVIITTPQAAAIPERFRKNASVFRIKDSKASHV